MRHRDRYRLALQRIISAVTVDVPHCAVSPVMPLLAVTADAATRPSGAFDRSGSHISLIPRKPSRNDSDLENSRGSHRAASERAGVSTSSIHGDDVVLSAVDSIVEPVSASGSVNGLDPSPTSSMWRDSGVGISAAGISTAVPSSLTEDVREGVRRAIVDTYHTSVYWWESALMLHRLLLALVFTFGSRYPMVRTPPMPACCLQWQCAVTLEGGVTAHSIVTFARDYSRLCVVSWSCGTLSVDTTLCCARADSFVTVSSVPAAAAQ